MTAPQGSDVSPSVRSDSDLGEPEVDNVRLREEAVRGQLWSGALSEVTTALLSGTDQDILGLIADRAATLIGAEFVSIITPQGDSGDFVVRAVHGQDSKWLEGRIMSADETLAPTAMARRAPVVLPSPNDMEGFGPIGPIIMMPLMASGTPIGVMSVARRPGFAPFKEDELAMVSEFGRQASVAMELARAQADSRRLELVEERNRIARDLHDHVIQRLVAVGLSLGRAAQGADASVAATIDGQIGAIQLAIDDIRTAVFALRVRSTGAADSLRSRVLSAIREFEPAFEQPVRFSSSGPVDLLVNDDTAEEVIAVVRELVSNAAQHAAAKCCSVDLSLSADSLIVRVSDDGRGISPPTPRSGLVNLEERARRLSGTFTVSDAEPHGTMARWQVPVTAVEDGAR